MAAALKTANSDRIKEVEDFNRYGEAVVLTYGGLRYSLSLRECGGREPRCGESIYKYIGRR